MKLFDLSKGNVFRPAQGIHDALFAYRVVGKLVGCVVVERMFFVNGDWHPTQEPRLFWVTNIEVTIVQ